MARGSVCIEDYLEDKIRSYMKINKIKTKNKAINEIISTFFEYEKVLAVKTATIRFLQANLQTRTNEKFYPYKTTSSPNGNTHTCFW